KDAAIAAPITQRMKDTLKPGVGRLINALHCGLIRANQRKTFVHLQ
ncbi:hypothetical protein MNBD_NITROSPINAE04-2425, partial [hydrothermal vent metagenome]